MPRRQTISEPAAPDSGVQERLRARKLLRTRSQQSSGNTKTKRTVTKYDKHKNAAVAGSERAKCPVCYKIEYLFRKDIDVLNSSIDLGSLTYVLSLPCKKHQNLILSTLKHRLYPEIGEAPIQRLSAFKFADSSLGFKGDTADDVANAYGWYIRLLPNPNRSHTCTGRLVKTQWIQPSLARKWISQCDRLHGNQCSEGIIQSCFGKFSPQWLIDTWGQCIVPGAGVESYAALSYVWGSRPIYTTRRTNLEIHQNVGTLRTLPLAGTIRDALDVIEKMGERYCWVDALCIVQDDQRSKYTEIENMSAIFANASFTLVAEVEDAQEGLEGISRPRDFGQKVFRLNSGSELIQERRYNEKTSTWMMRAWTFQERLFSRRLLIFDKASVRWQCQAAKWFEDVLPDHPADKESLSSPKHQRAIESDVPNSKSLEDLLFNYNQRNLTFPTDALYAFMGTLTALQRCYKGSFISGLPLVFFDIALLWQPLSYANRRSSNMKETASAGMPSWSWSGWQCDISPWSWIEFMAYIKEDYNDGEYNKAAIPTVQWCYHHEVGGQRVEIKPDWYDYRTRYFGTDEEAPSGWTKHSIYESSPEFDAWPDHYLNESIPRCFYRCDKIPDLEFWYPIPLPEASDTASPSTASFISCRTRRSWLKASRFGENHNMFLATADGNEVGNVKVFETKAPETDTKMRHHWLGQLVEIVELSKGHCYEDFRVVEHYYNVMWIEWETGFACRKGVGTVGMQAWDSLELEHFDLTLG